MLPLSFHIPPAARSVYGFSLNTPTSTHFEDGNFSACRNVAVSYCRGEQTPKNFQAPMLLSPGLCKGIYSGVSHVARQGGKAPRVL